MMKQFILPLIVIFCVALFACNKDELPDEFSIYGRWKEKTTDSARTEIEFRKRNVLLLKLRTDTVSRSLNYLLERQNELQIFEQSEFPDGISTKHKITYNSKEDQISIYGLYPSTTEQSVTVFLRN